VGSVNRTMERDFVAVADALVAELGARTVADALGVKVQTYRQMRGKPGASGTRRPPADWALRLARLKSAALARANARTDALRQLPDFP
jgi:hypothetical protein